MEFALRIASEFAVTVDSYLTQQKYLRERDRLQMLFDVTNSLVSKLSPDALFAAVSEQVSKAVTCDLAALALFDNKTDELFLSGLHIAGQDLVDLDATRARPDGLPSGEAISTGRPVVIDQPDFERFPSPPHRRWADAGFCCGCSIPLVTPNAILGTLELARKERQPFTKEDVELLLFVKVNCAAIPASLLESELFGHEKGAFTGALTQRVGRFELAHHGTLFLDEIGEIPLELQSKLLRAIQEQESERLGGSRTIHTDIRFIAASNRNLKAMVDEGNFRSGLYYRLHVFPLPVPPWRERREDIPLLTCYFTQKYAQRMGRKIDAISSPSMDTLVCYDWPGNIRELQNVIERSVVLTRGRVLELAMPEISTGPVAAPPKSDLGSAGRAGENPAGFEGCQRHRWRPRRRTCAIGFKKNDTSSPDEETRNHPRLSVDLIESPQPHLKPPPE